MARYVLEEKDILLEWKDRPGDPVEVIADLEKLKRTVLNIIGNAHNFMDKKQNIGVSIRLSPEWVTVEIRDNGMGIDPEAIPHIFERFYRAEPSRNSATGGGWGLPLPDHRGTRGYHLGGERAGRRHKPELYPQTSEYEGGTLIHDGTYSHH